MVSSNINYTMDVLVALIMCSVQHSKDIEIIFWQNDKKLFMKPAGSTDIVYTLLQLEILKLTKSSVPVGRVCIYERFFNQFRLHNIIT